MIAHDKLPPKMRAYRLQRLAERVLEYVDWCNTPQGYDYWDGVHKNLIALARAEESDNARSRDNEYKY